MVPNGITKLRITAVGAVGLGAGSLPAATHGGGVGGAGEKVVATVPVTGGETLYPREIAGGIGDYNVPLTGFVTPNPGGPGSGGAGVAVSPDPSGSSCYMNLPTSQPLVVAGGGGGGGWGDISGPGGTGGSAGADAGGAGNPGDDNDAPAGAGGGGGTQSAGGGGGAGGRIGVQLAENGFAGAKFFAGWGGLHIFGYLLSLGRRRRRGLLRRWWWRRLGRRRWRRRRGRQQLRRLWRDGCERDLDHGYAWDHLVADRPGKYESAGDLGVSLPLEDAQPRRPVLGMATTRFATPTGGGTAPV